MRSRIFNILIILLILLQVQDGICTYVGIDNFGIEIEANPFIVFLIDIFGLFWGIALPKVFAIIFAAFIYYALSDRIDRYVLCVVSFIDLFYIYAAVQWCRILAVEFYFFS